MSIGCAGAEDIPEPTCDDLDEWETEVQELSHAILWDVDYEDAELYIDFPPEESKRLRNWAGIPDNYFLGLFAVHEKNLIYGIFLLTFLSYHDTLPLRMRVSKLALFASIASTPQIKCIFTI